MAGKKYRSPKPKTPNKKRGVVPATASIHRQLKRDRRRF